MGAADYFLAMLFALACFGIAFYGFAISLFAREMYDGTEAVHNKRAGLFRILLGLFGVAYFTGVIVAGDWGWVL